MPIAVAVLPSVRTASDGDREQEEEAFDRMEKTNKLVVVYYCHLSINRSLLGALCMRARADRPYTAHRTHSHANEADNIVHRT